MLANEFAILHKTKAHTRYFEMLMSPKHNKELYKINILEVQWSYCKRLHFVHVN